MELKDQVITVNQAKRLIELGVSEPGYFMWTEHDSEDGVQYGIMQYEKEGYGYVGVGMAYGAVELSQMLPARIFHENEDWFMCIHKGKRGWYIQYQTNKKDAVVNMEGELDRPRFALLKTWRDDFNLASALGKYLILLLENKLLNPS